MDKTDINPILLMAGLGISEELWSSCGQDFEGLIWKDPSSPACTQKEFDDKKEEMMKNPDNLLPPMENA